MKIESLQGIIAEWLADSLVAPLTPRLGHSVNAGELTSILAIVGPRRAGKTYFIFQVVMELIASGQAQKDDILFVDFEDFRLKGFVPEDVDNLLVAFNKLTGKSPRYLCFDEVQHVPDWSRMLRTLHNRRAFKIIVSGSNSSLLSREIATELRGRYIDEIMFPFSFKEFLALKHVPCDEITLHTARKGEVLAAFDDYLQHGGFPEVASKGSLADKRKLLQNYYNTVFHCDIIERHGIKAEHLLDRMMRCVLENYTEQFSVSKFERQLKAAGLHGSKRTLANYLRFLEGAFFILRSERFSYSARARAMNPCKVYLVDTGFSFLGEPFSENRGKLLENVVAQELARGGNQLSFFKGKGECDFVLTGGGLGAGMAIQVCWELNQRNERRELSGVAEAMKALDLRRGMILTYNQEEMVRHEGHEIALLPVWKWLLA